MLDPIPERLPGSALRSALLLTQSIDICHSKGTDKLSRLENQDGKPLGAVGNGKRKCSHACVGVHRHYMVKLCKSLMSVSLANFC